MQQTKDLLLLKEKLLENSYNPDIKTLNAIYLSCEIRLKELNNGFSKLLKTRDLLIKKQQDLINSISWKITKPIRSINKKIRSIKKLLC